MIVLGIETSCDETGVALYDTAKGLLSHQLFSQIDLHAPYGGVVPELAARSHAIRLIPLIDALLQESQCLPQAIDCIAYTAGPGLIGSLLIGVSTAQALALAWGKPSFAMHHLEAHLLLPLFFHPEVSFPFLGLIVSGGHTQLYLASSLGRYRLLGETKDDAAGEAFDKVAHLLGLSYPGGAALSQLARHGVHNAYHFPHPMCKERNLEMSFSGLKTHTANLIRKLSPLSREVAANIALAFEQAMVDTLVQKLIWAAEEHQLFQVVLAGGVSANTPLYQSAQRWFQQQGGAIFRAPTPFCTDNGVMVAHAAGLRLRNFPNSLDKQDRLIRAYPRWPLPSATAQGEAL